VSFIVKFKCPMVEYALARLLSMLVHCFPDASVRSKVMALAEEEGVQAFDNGCCIRFNGPKDAAGLSKLLKVINYGKLLASAEELNRGDNPQ
jgi:hypothetical protein